jgi:hypothetical protein
MTLSEAKVEEIIVAGTPAPLYENKRVLVLTPDGTRTCPLPVAVRAVSEVIGEWAARLNLGYMDPAKVRLSDYMGREEEGILYVDHAGEILYRLEQEG